MIALSLFRCGELCHSAYLEAAHEFRNQGEPSSDLLILRPSYLLHGMGLEALVKGIIVAQESAAIQKSNFYTHNLNKLCDRAGISLERPELSVLLKLSTLVEWAGRYPISKWDSEKGRSRADVEVRMEEGKHVIDATMIPGLLGESDWSIVLSIIEKAEHKYRVVMDLS